MKQKPLEHVEPIEDPNALIEKALIEEYLKEKGYTLESLHTLEARLAETLMKEASQYASLKMEEVKARAHLVEELHNDASPLTTP